MAATAEKLGQVDKTLDPERLLLAAIAEEAENRDFKVKRSTIVQEDGKHTLTVAITRDVSGQQKLKLVHGEVTRANPGGRKAAKKKPSQAE